MLALGWPTILLLLTSLIQGQNPGAMMKCSAQGSLRLRVCAVQRPCHPLASLSQVTTAIPELPQRRGQAQGIVENHTVARQPTFQRGVQVVPLRFQARQPFANGSKENESVKE